LRQEVEERVGKEKTPNPRKQKKEGEQDAPMTGTGTFSVVEERGTICASS
jgi:hypothetical protein